jgi:hypothetical protein
MIAREDNGGNGNDGSDGVGAFAARRSPLVVAMVSTVR